MLTRSAASWYVHGADFRDFHRDHQQSVRQIAISFGTIAVYRQDINAAARMMNDINNCSINTPLSGLNFAPKPEHPQTSSGFAALGALRASLRCPALRSGVRFSAPNVRFQNNKRRLPADAGYNLLREGCDGR